MEQWKRRKGQAVALLLLVAMVSQVESCGSVEGLSGVDKQLAKYVDGIFSADSVDVMPGVGIERVRNGTEEENCSEAKSLASVEDYFYNKWNDFSKNHVVSVNIPETARFLKSTGKSSFLAGFGMGFLAFALKKLLLPVFIGAQLVKSVLIAMFLPSILGSLGKIVGKGLSTFSGFSGSSAGLGGAGANQQVEDFEFKDTGPYNNDVAETTNTETPQQAMNRLSFEHARNPFQGNENYYYKHSNKKTDYKVFHKIPSSSMLLTTYDPFYSPLLSRLDSVFQQLGLGSKGADTEKCRERLVCMMYANPAKYAPYSNLVSAQLSRELNELRKPASDNPEILRFFKYMKAAKDGQDGEECLAHGGCPSLTSHQQSPAMLTTFNDINKLVQARKIQ
ncbi:PREDICTED: uncharacterized protein LOC108558720 isoform X2 [Nicrophorus vespilloides]|uniref:Uncharacterized protein LOC108558720 isoform X2 n=1 Tax=Nicrophorus vespilloides TaxID=110193 RepID=A0ABM1M9F4_NICVS|nr:PREDICTED: uncharacterized protein LOC108558720 isoform X2 [Nicrophorus vespilloides]